MTLVFIINFQHNCSELDQHLMILTHTKLVLEQVAGLGLAACWPSDELLSHKLTTQEAEIYTVCSQLAIKVGPSVAN